MTSSWHHSVSTLLIRYGADAAAPVQLVERGDDVLACPGLGRRGDGVLQVEEDEVGVADAAPLAIIFVECPAWTARSGGHGSSGCLHGCELGEDLVAVLVEDRGRRYTPPGVVAKRIGVFGVSTGRAEPGWSMATYISRARTCGSSSEVGGVVHRAARHPPGKVLDDLGARCASRSTR